MARNLNNVPLHDFYENHPANPHGYVATTSKIGVFGGELSNSGLQRVVDVKKMPLITVNSGTQKKSEAIGAMLHIGQPELLAGEKAGEKARRANIHSFVCLNHDVTNSSSQERCNGFARGLGPDAKMVMLELDGDSVAMQAKISQYLTAHADTEAMLALGTTSAHAALETIKSSKVHPYFATFDLSGPISDGIKAGTVAFAIDQQPYLQGYLAVALLAVYTRVRQLNAQVIDC